MNNPQYRRLGYLAYCIYKKCRPIWFNVKYFTWFWPKSYQITIYFLFMHRRTKWFSSVQSMDADKEVRTRYSFWLSAVRSHIHLKHFFWRQETILSVNQWNTLSMIFYDHRIFKSLTNCKENFFFLMKIINLRVVH